MTKARKLHFSEMYNKTGEETKNLCMQVTMGKPKKLLVSYYFLVTLNSSTLILKYLSLLLI